MHIFLILQAQYIHQLVQSRLFVEEDPLVDLYKCLRILTGHVSLIILFWEELYDFRIISGFIALPGCICHKLAKFNNYFIPC